MWLLWLELGRGEEGSTELPRLRLDGRAGLVSVLGYGPVGETMLFDLPCRLLLLAVEPCLCKPGETVALHRLFTLSERLSIAL